MCPNPTPLDASFTTTDQEFLFYFGVWVYADPPALQGHWLRRCMKGKGVLAASLHHFSDRFVPIVVLMGYYSALTFPFSISVTQSQRTSAALANMQPRLLLIPSTRRCQWLEPHFLLLEKLLLMNRSCWSGSYKHRVPGKAHPSCHTPAWAKSSLLTLWWRARCDGVPPGLV